jgi:hypothetical protein
MTSSIGRNVAAFLPTTRARFPAQRSYDSAATTGSNYSSFAPEIFTTAVHFGISLLM